LILRLFAGTPEIKRGDVKKAVLEFHRSRGSLVNEKSPYTTTALRALEKKVWQNNFVMAIGEYFNVSLKIKMTFRVSSVTGHKCSTNF